MRWDVDGRRSGPPRRPRPARRPVPTLPTMEEVRTVIRSDDRARLLRLHDELLTVARSGTVGRGDAHHVSTIIKAVEDALTVARSVIPTDDHKEAQRPFDERLEATRQALASRGAIVPDGERRTEHRHRPFPDRLEDAKRALYGG